MKTRPMILLMAKVLVFLAPIAAGLGFLEWRVDQVPTDLDVKRRVLASRGGASEVIILGSSQAAFGIDPARIACPTVNLASQIKTLDVDAALVRAFAREWHQAKILVVPVAPFSFQARMGAVPPARWRVRKYRSAFGLDLPSPGLTSWIGDSHLVRRTPRGLLELARSGFRAPPSRVRDDGWEEIADREGGEAGPDAVKGQRVWMQQSEGADLGADLDFILTTARTANVTPVLLVPPYRRDYLAAWTDQELCDFRRRIGDAARRFNAVLADYSADPRFDDLDFWDCSHLSPRGATRFSEILSKEVIIPLSLCGTTTEAGIAPTPAERTRPR